MPLRHAELDVVDTVAFPAAPAVAVPALVVEDALAGLKSVAETGSLFLGLTYVAGWSFLASYYMAFGINPWELDFSVPATSAFAVHVLGNSLWVLLLAATLFFSLVVFYARLGAARRAWAGLCVAVLVFAVATAGTLRGRRLAAEDMFETSARLPSVGFVGKGTPREPNCLARGTTDCRLLLHAKGAYYFFEPVAGAAKERVHGLNIRLYIVPESEVTSTKLVRGVE